MNPFTWEELIRQARDIENDLDAKLAAFSSNYFRPNNFKSMPETLQEQRSKSPHFVVSCLENVREKIEGFDKPDSAKLTSEIDQLLQRLSQVNDQMSDLVHDAEVPSSLSGSARTPLSTGQLSQLHTAKRHKELLRDYSQEFRQMKAKLAAQCEREELLGSVFRDVITRDDSSVHETVSLSSTGSGSHRGSTHSQSVSTRLLMEEQERYHRSNRLMDGHLAAASTIRATLRNQRMALRNASDDLHKLISRFPRVKQLIGKIDWRHRKDSIILGLVISCCVAFLIIYKYA